MAVVFLTSFSFPSIMLNRCRVSSMNKPMIGLVASSPVLPMPKQKQRAFAPVSFFSSTLCRASDNDIISESTIEEEKSELMELFLKYIKEHIPPSAERWSHYQSKREWNGYAHHGMKKLSEERNIVYLDGKEWVNGHEQTQFWFENSSNRICEIVVAEKSVLLSMEGTKEPIKEIKLWDLISQRDAEEEEKNQVDTKEKDEKIDSGGEVETAIGEGKENN